MTFNCKKCKRQITNFMNIFAKINDGKCFCGNKILMKKSEVVCK